jgi:hypothetical protein
LRVELLSECEIAVLESRVALLFESVGGGGHLMGRATCGALAGEMYWLAQ